MPANGQGILTIAYGPEKYVRMAKALARSYRRQNPGRPMAVVTDDANANELGRFFDLVVPVDYGFGSGVVQKLHADLYSPFEQTLFIDSDCLFYRSPEEVWHLYAGKPFSVRGWRYLTGDSEYERRHPYEWVYDTSAFLRVNGLSRLPHFNSGVFFFDRSVAANSVFEAARRVYADRANLGFVQFKNAPIADEPAFAVAMERCKLEMDPWNSDHGMETAIGIERVEEIDIQQGIARFYKSGTLRTPSVLHFNVNAQSSLIYNREMYRLAFEHRRAARLRASVSLWNRMAMHYGGRALQIARRLPKRLARRLGAG